MENIKYIWPNLGAPGYDLGFFRVGGAGLANCLFVAARAHLRARDLGCEMLRPTWERLSMGQWLRGERDKRFYFGLFREESFFRKLRKLFLILTRRRVEEIVGLGAYFEDLLARQSEVRSWFDAAVDPAATRAVPTDMKRSVAVHVRLGDFPANLRMPNSWYVALIEQVRSAVGHDVDVQVFSDGSDDELAEILSIPGARRAFYGNALADLVAISRCGLLIAGKQSTFSAWGAFLGGVPSIFSEIDYGRIVATPGCDVRLGSSAVIPENLVEGLISRVKEADGRGHA